MGPALEIPDDPLARFVLQRAASLGDRLALVDGVSGRQLTYGALADGVNRVACALRRRGFKKGDVFAIFSPNLPEYPIAFHAVASLGGIITTLNSLYTPRELSDQLRDSHARYLLTVPAFMDRATEAISGLPIDEVFVFGQAPAATPFSELISQAPEPLTVEIDPAEDVVALPYSSGTTGLAKGVMLTHRNLIANVLQAEQRIHLREGERVLGVMPFYHIYGMTVIMNLALHSGATVVTMPRFELETFLRVMQDYKVARAYVAPPIVVAQANGEILIRGPQVMKGYLNNPAATAQILDRDGWLHTGDIGHADAEGDFYVVDRLKELIKYKGYQVPPAELEAILLTHPAVADAAVIASPDEDAGEVPKAFVVLKTEATPEELIQFVASRVAPHKKIRLVETIDEIPKSASGKILRRKLVEKERAKTSAK